VLDVSGATHGKSAGIAPLDGLQCAVVQLFQSMPMRMKKRRLQNFEACSVALFASLALGGTSLAARSQAPSTPSSTSPRSAVAPAASKAGPSREPRQGQVFPSEHLPPSSPVTRSGEATSSPIRRQS
jgi:hypothetical protein